MARLEPCRREDHPDLESEFKFCEEFLGFLPNDVLTLAHIPEVAKSFTNFCQSIYQSGNVDPGLLQLVGTVTSSAAGCRYCTAHMAQTSSRFGVTQEKLDQVWLFESSPEFSERERSVLRVAMHAGQSPNAVSDEDIDALKKYYPSSDIVQLMSVIALFGFLNRWNDSLATKLENTPREFAEKSLQATDWEVGKHDA